MIDMIRQRRYWVALLSIVAVIGCMTIGPGTTTAPGAPAASGAQAKKPAQEYYELRVYRIENAEKQKIVSTYLENALLPALNRINIDRVGVFTAMDQPDDLSIHVLIAYPSLRVLADLSNTLAADGAYQKAESSNYCND